MNDAMHVDYGLCVVLAGRMQRVTMPSVGSNACVQ